MSRRIVLRTVVGVPQCTSSAWRATPVSHAPVCPLQVAAPCALTVRAAVIVSCVVGVPTPTSAPPQAFLAQAGRLAHSASALLRPSSLAGPRQEVGAHAGEQQRQAAARVDACAARRHGGGHRRQRQGQGGQGGGGQHQARRHPGGGRQHQGAGAVLGALLWGEGHGRVGERQSTGKGAGEGGD